MTAIIAACDGVTQWPDVVVLALFLAFFLGAVWVMTR